MIQALRIAINGYGRIGRCFLRALHEAGLEHDFQIVLINEPSDLDSMVYLTRFDSTHGVFPGTVQAGVDSLLVNQRPIAVTHEKTPEAVDWAAHGIDLVVECSGQYGARHELMRFIDAGCPRLLLSHPGLGAADVDYTVVFGTNQQGLTGAEQLVSNASCTTNAVVPLLHDLHDRWGVEQVFLTTLHSVMNDQPLIDGYHHTDLRRTRSAMQSIVPVSTGLARGVERLLPALAGRVQAKAIRVPTLNVSAIDLMVLFETDTSAEQLNAGFKALSSQLPGLVDWSSHPHASIDFNHNPHSAIIDTSQTRLNGTRLANVFVWFDNEWGFANRLLDTLRYWATRL